MVVNPSKSVPVESCQPRHSHTNQPALAVISAVFYKNCEFRHFVQQRSDIGECNGRKHYWREFNSDLTLENVTVESIIGGEFNSDLTLENVTVESIIGGSSTAI